MTGDELVRTEAGAALFLDLREKALELLKVSGAVLGRTLVEGVPGDTGQMFQCVDRMEEMGIINLVGSLDGGFPADKVYVRGKTR